MPDRWEVISNTLGDHICRTCGKWIIGEAAVSPKGMYYHRRCAPEKERKELLKSKNEDMRK